MENKTISHDQKPQVNDQTQQNDQTDCSADYALEALRNIQVHLSDSDFGKTKRRIKTKATISNNSRLKN